VELVRKLAVEFDDAQIARVIDRQGRRTGNGNPFTMDDPGTVVQDRSLYGTFITLLLAPDLVVYLRASVPTLLERVGRRGRGFEAGISREHLEGLNALYVEWIFGFRLALVLVVPADRMYFVTDTGALGEIVATVEERLRDRQGLLFPYGM
jgi:hypothetical protein